MLIALTLAAAQVVQVPPMPPVAGKVWIREDFPPDPPSPTSVPSAGTQGPAYSADAYPEEALRNREQGRAVIGVTVGVNGRATRCWVIETSNSPALDSASCYQAFRRVRWTPAKDNAGKPIESEVRLPVRWVLPK
jgi:protein TonB